MSKTHDTEVAAWPRANRWATRLGGVIALLCAVGLAGCRGEAPVGVLEVSPAAFDLALGGYVPLQVRLEPEVALPAGTSATPTLFIHLLDAQGELVRTYDQTLASAWQVGEAQRLEVPILQSALAVGLAEGRYVLTVGLYDPGTRQRFSLRHTGKARERGEIEVAAVTVPGAAKVPPLVLTGAWLAPAAGADRQVLMRRGFSGEVSLVVGAAAGNGRLLLAFELPTLGEPRLDLVSDCAQDQVVLSGGGRHRLEVAVPAAGCTLTLRPLLPSATDEPAIAVLEGLAWRPDGE